MGIMDEILQKVGLKYDDLSKAERETLFSWSSSLKQKQLTVNTIKEHIQAMKFQVEKELADVGHNSKQDIFLKARLRNYMLLEAFLDSPEKAEQAIERALAGLVSNKKGA